MCGIGGVYYPDGRPVNGELLQKMAALTRYRGPDDQGFFKSGGIGFFHNRLSVIDLVTGHQPLSNEDETIQVIFNGEIYNYLELRDVLIGKGHVFKSHSDTEVLVHLYEEHGPECLDKLNGMFAFAVWDDKNRSLFIARDRMGIKPLYYYYDGEVLVFASEIKALALHPRVEVALNYPGLLDYLTFQYTLNDKTLFKNIKKLLPGHYLTIVNSQMRLRQYWEIEAGDYEENTKEVWAEKLRALLEDSVRLRLRSDVPLGAHLSGGVDSGSLVCLAAELLGGRVNTFSAGFAEGGVFHDLDYCQITSEAAATEHFEIVPSAADFAEIIPQLVWHMDEPAAAEGIFPQYYVSRLASERVKVVLGGQGGDEILGGYTRYYLLYLEAALKHEILGTGDELGMTIADLLPQLYQLKKYQPLMRSFFQDDLFGDSDRRYFNLIRRGKIDELLSPEAIKEADDYQTFEEYRRLFNSPKESVPLLDRVLYYECKASLTALLQVEDRTSMAVSLESRVPFLDHRIVELAFKMPPEVKFHQGQMKHVLKRAMRGVVPDPILDRPDKLGFPVPLNQWSQNQLKDFIHDLMDNGELEKSGLLRSGFIKKYTGGGVPFNRTLWGLLNLELWLRLFLKGEGYSRFANPLPYPARLSLTS